MAYLDIKITLLSPVILSANVEDRNLTGTLGYIPATSLIGLFASKYIQKVQPKEAHLDDKFNSWFLKGELIFNNAYISEIEDYDEIDMLPTPLCLKKEKVGERIFNVLLKEVDEQLKPAPPYSNIYGNKLVSKEPEKKINFHHNRDRLTGHTKDEAIFNYEALLPGQVFKGKIYGDSETLKIFRDNYQESFFARLGKSRNTEYGRVQINLSEIKQTEIKAIDKQYYEERNPVLLTFISPCIILNEFGFSDPSLRSLENYLEKFWGKDSFEIKKCVMKTTNIENYISVWRMKRPLETAIAAGSTIMVYFKENLTYEEMKNGLLHMLEQGIGERRGEGFGRVEINMAMSEEYYEKEVKNAIKKPAGEMPEEAKKIFRNIIKEIFKQETEFRAFKDVNDFKDLPSSSLLGKLDLMLTNSQGYDFNIIIDDLRDNAKNQLRCCSTKHRRLYGRQYILFDYLKEFDVIDVVNSIYNYYSKYLTLANLIGYNLKSDSNLLLELWRIYFTVFFRQMRKERQKEELSK